MNEIVAIQRKTQYKLTLVITNTLVMMLYTICFLDKELKCQNTQRRSEDEVIEENKR